MLARIEVLASATDDQHRERQLVLTSAPSVEAWQSALADVVGPSDSGAGFALFLMADATTTSTDTIAELAEWCISHGVFSVSAWGPGCERVHDIFDEVDVELRLPTGDAPFDDVVMTTWHSNESLAEALEYFWTCTIAADGRTWGPRWIVCSRAQLMGGRGAVPRGNCATELVAPTSVVLACKMVRRRRRPSRRSCA